MKILVDTCVWSGVLRHKSPEPKLLTRMKNFIEEGRVVIIGPIRQELLSGVSTIAQFNKLKQVLSFFEDTVLRTEHFVKAAEFSNICRSKGVQGSTIDFLISAVSCMENFIIFTTDNDFRNYSNYLPLKLLR